MLTKRLIIFLTITLTGTGTLTALAQEDSLLLRDYTFIRSSDPWLTHRNASALTRYNTSNIAEAEVMFSLAGGRLTPADGSPLVVQAGANVESFYRLSPRTVAYGGISYDNWSGNDMSGSAFIPVNVPRPFDLVEATTDNAGRKHRDTYRLEGALGVDVWKGYSAGARLSYTSANYAKYKDLRHKNKLMNLQFSVGGYAPVLPWMSVGADYTYYRQTESVTFSVNGKADKVYKTFIDYGAGLGLEEQFGNEGFTDSSRELPFFEDRHGGSVQVELRPFRALSLFAQASLSHGTGYYGSESPYTITYTNHKRDIAEVTGRVTYVPGSGTVRHYLDLVFADEMVHNYANTYVARTNEENGATYYEYYDPTETGSKQLHTLSARYTLHHGIKGELPTWTATAGFLWQQLNAVAYLFPQTARQLLTMRHVDVSCTRNILMQRGVLSFTVGGGMSYRYLAKSSYNINWQAKYSFVIPQARLKPHVRLAFDHSKATEKYNGYDTPDYTTGTIAVGCTF